MVYGGIRYGGRINLGHYVRQRAWHDHAHVGAQGGSLEEVCRYGMNSECGLLVNSSRGIIYASNGEDFAEVAAQKAEELQKQMDQELQKYGI